MRPGVNKENFGIFTVLEFSAKPFSITPLQIQSLFESRYLQSITNDLYLIVRPMGEAGGHYQNLAIFCML